MELYKVKSYTDTNGVEYKPTMCLTWHRIYDTEDNSEPSLVLFQLWSSDCGKDEWHRIPTTG